MNASRRSLRILWMALPVIAALILLALPATIGAAGVADLPPRQPTATPAPTVAPTSAPTAPDKGIAGAHIDLTAPDAPPWAWAVVQWQDGNGAWHDVDGWRARLSDGYQEWWLDRNSYGAGPFRWCVLDSAMGPVLGASEPFYMPARSGEWVHVTLSIATAD